QAKGQRLVIGLIVLVAGFVLTFGVIYSGHGQQGAQEVSFYENAALYNAVWRGVQISMSLIAVAGIAGLVALAARGFASRVEFWIAAIILAPLVWLAAWLWIAKDAMLYEAGMRILWQLLKSLLAAGVLQIASSLIFKRRGGIVVIHAGLLLMMAGEVVVSQANVETLMTLEEGQVRNYGEDMRTTELVFVDRSGDDTDKVIAVPASRLSTGKEISDESVPFDLRIEKFLENTRTNNNNLITAKEASQADPAYTNIATDGLGVHLAGVEAPRSTGTESEQDRPSVYVTLIDKESGGEVGTYFCATFFDERPVHRQTVTAKGASYDIALRFRRIYKDYVVQLIDTRRKNYMGTGKGESGTPSDYESDIKVVNQVTAETRDKVKVWMNNPLRYAGDTFYQSGHHFLGDGKEASTLSVVSNIGWMIPYTACMIVGMGLLAHFVPVLIRFLKRDRYQGEKSRAIVLPLVVVGAAIAYTYWAAVPSRSDGLMVHRFGRNPVVYLGRVMPFDTLARNSLQQISDRTTFKAVMKPDELEENWDAISRDVQGRWSRLAASDLAAIKGDVTRLVELVSEETGLGKDIAEFQVHEIVSTRQPAVVWLLDVMSDSPRALEHKVFRIENQEVLNLFDLHERPGLTYSYNELADGLEELAKANAQVERAARQDKYSLSIYQKKVSELYRKVAFFRNMQLAFVLPKPEVVTDSEYLYNLLEQAQKIGEARYPLPVPSNSEPGSWAPLPTAAVQNALLVYADRHGDTMADEFAETLSQEVFNADKTTTPDAIRRLMLAQMVRRMQPQLPEDAVDRQVDFLLKGLDEGNLPPGFENVQEVIEEQVAVTRARLQSALQIEITGDAMTLHGQTELPPLNPVTKHLIAALEAYRMNDAEVFNRELAAYEDAVVELDPEKLRPGDSWIGGIVASRFGSFYQFEEWFNDFNPFGVSCVLYIVALVIALLAGLGFTPAMNRTALWLTVFTFALHTCALVWRMYISGRPPVTNLYSSAVFIGWACVVFGMILEVLFRLGVGNLVAALSGFPTLLIASALATDGDTFTVLQAVLDTQFWLATHVVCITLGYAATFLAGALGLIYIARGLVVPWGAKFCRQRILPTFRERMSQERYRRCEAAFTPDVSPQFARELVRMIYGILCFAIIFSFIGTVLGGLWADDSWGRFWGWDPKENGALIIVLWNAVVLHARWGGLVKERGLAVLSVVGNIATTWSWFGVNELSIGKHTYGFTEGRLSVLLLFLLSQAVIVAFASLPKKYWWPDGDLSENTNA
ncbi:MAG: cytochrome c biogenesis protein CcsA, partial [Pirellulales bacterium]